MPIPAAVIRVSAVASAADEQSATDAGVRLDRAVAMFVEDLEIPKAAALKAYRSDLAQVIALLPDHAGPWPVTELTGSVLHATFARFAAGRASVSRARGT